MIEWFSAVAITSHNNPRALGIKDIFFKFGRITGYETTSLVGSLDTKQRNLCLMFRNPSPNVVLLCYCRVFRFSLVLHEHRFSPQA